MTTKPHRLPVDEFDALAGGGGDEGTIAHLRAAERSRRLLTLRAVLDATVPAGRLSGPLPGVQEAWDLLVEVQRREPRVVEAILSFPHAGTWAGQLLRRLRDVSAVPFPPWAMVGYLHGLAAAAAIRAGSDFSMRLPVRAGVCVLPTLGFASLPTDAEWETADVRGESGRVSVTGAGATVDIPADPETDAPCWHGIRRLHADVAGMRYTMSLDDVDPYREADRILPPQRLGPAEVERWRELFSGAWALLVEQDLEYALALRAALTTIVPRSAAHRFGTFSASAEESFGSATISLPPDAVTLAVTLQHEFQHAKLGALQHLVPLYSGPADERLYAPWRTDPRPAPNLLQGLYAFLGVAAFWRARRHLATGTAARFAHFEFAHWRGQTWRVWQQLGSQPGLTELGVRFVTGIGTRLAPWQAEPVPADLLAAASAVADDNYASWRIRHVRPSLADVSRLADAWMDGRPSPTLNTPDSVAAAGRSTPRNARAALIRLSVADPQAFKALLASPSPGDMRGLVPGDLAYASGDHDAAARAYREQIAADPNRVDAWVGLGLAAAAAGRRSTAAALLQRPELVRALYKELSNRKDTPPIPDALAAWLG